MHGCLKASRVCCLCVCDCACSGMRRYGHDKVRIMPTPLTASVFTSSLLPSCFDPGRKMARETTSSVGVHEYFCLCMSSKTLSADSTPTEIGKEIKVFFLFVAVNAQNSAPCGQNTSAYSIPHLLQSLIRSLLPIQQLGSPQVPLLKPCMEATATHHVGVHLSSAGVALPSGRLGHLHSAVMAAVAAAPVSQVMSADTLSSANYKRHTVHQQQQYDRAGCACAVLQRSSSPCVWWWNARWNSLAYNNPPASPREEQ